MVLRSGYQTPEKYLIYYKTSGIIDIGNKIILIIDMICISNKNTKFSSIVISHVIYLYSSLYIIHRDKYILFDLVLLNQIGSILGFTIHNI